MFKKLLRINERRKTTIFDKILKRFSYKPAKIDCNNNYNVLKCYTSRDEIEGLEVNHGCVGNHLRGSIEDYFYFHEGITKFSHAVKKNTLKNYDEKRFYVALIKKKYNEICDSLSSELKTLPDYIGKSYRYSDLKNIDTYKSKIKVGDLVMDKSYLSSSIYKGSGGMAQWGVEDPESNASGNFTIESKSGKYINDISKAKNEHEVLFDIQTIFKVTKIENSSHKTFYIFMEETSNENQVDQIKDIYSGDLIN